MMRAPILFLIAALAGCASGPRYGESGIRPSDNPMVYIVRAPGFQGMGVKPVVFVNGVRIGELSGGGYFACSVPPGRVRIGASITTGDPPSPGAVSPPGSKDITQFSFMGEPGKEYFLQWRPGPQVVLLQPGEEEWTMALSRRLDNAC